jgi:histone H3/H4
MSTEENELPKAVVARLLKNAVKKQKKRKHVD